MLCVTLKNPFSSKEVNYHLIFLKSSINQFEINTESTNSYLLCLLLFLCCFLQGELLLPDLPVGLLLLWRLTKESRWNNGFIGRIIMVSSQILPEINHGILLNSKEFLLVNWQNLILCEFPYSVGNLCAIGIEFIWNLLKHEVCFIKISLKPCRWIMDTLQGISKKNEDGHILYQQTNNS